MKDCAFEFTSEDLENKRMKPVVLPSMEFTLARKPSFGPAGKSSVCCAILTVRLRFDTLHGSLLPSGTARGRDLALLDFGTRTLRFNSIIRFISLVESFAYLLFPKIPIGFLFGPTVGTVSFLS